MLFIYISYYTNDTRLQADLGTERRERISTNDVHDRYSRIGIDQINADRASNQVGSEVQRLAEKNKAQLNSWASKSLDLSM